MMRFFSAALISTVLLVVTSGFVHSADAASKKEKAERLVRNATETLRYFSDESDFTGLWETAKNAKAILVVPDSYRGGFIFGGSGGNAVMVAKNKDGSWSGPTFISIGSFSFGFQAGGEVSELVLLAMTNRGKERLLSSSAKLGADVSIAAGPVGIGAKAKTVDILAFSRSRGFYGGISLEGSILKARYNWNRAYYGSDVSPIDVVYKGVRDNPASIPLRDAAAALAARADRDKTTNSADAGYTNQAPVNAQPVVLAPTPAREDAIRYDDDAIYGNPDKRENDPQ